MSAIPSITIDALVGRYDLLLFDAYGVLVHAGGAMPGARTLIEALNRSAKPYFVVTNDASKLPATASARYMRFGLAIPPERIVSSGELLQDYFASHRLSGASCAVLGTRDSVRYVELAGGRVVPPDGDFDVLVIGDETGYPFLEAVDAALTALFHRLDAAQPVHLLVPNPDLIYPRGARSFGITAGSVALVLEAALQRRFGPGAPRFVRLGKPEPDLYQAAVARAGGGRAVMIGDQLETDIAGAIAAGIDSALVTTGVSAAPDDLPPELRPTWQLASIAPAGWVPAPTAAEGGRAPDEIDK
jgi:HAD superfamily hydrolase (TIGR01459 family)